METIFTQAAFLVEIVAEKKILLAMNFLCLTLHKCKGSLKQNTAIF